MFQLNLFLLGLYQSKTVSKVSQPTVSRIIKTVTTLLSELKLRFIKIPAKNDLKIITKKFHEIGKLTDVFGCIGSTQIPVKCPGKAIADGYLNEDGYYSFRTFVRASAEIVHICPVCNWLLFWDYFF